MRTDESDGIMGTDNSVMSTDEYIYICICIQFLWVVYKTDVCEWAQINIH